MRLRVDIAFWKIARELAEDVGDRVGPAR